MISMKLWNEIVCAFWVWRLEDPTTNENARLHSLQKKPQSAYDVLEFMMRN